MTDRSTDQTFDRILQSLRENNAELARELRSERTARGRQIAIMCAIFIGGIAAGALLVTAL
jgi:hypothetical protein